MTQGLQHVRISLDYDYNWIITIIKHHYSGTESVIPSLPLL